MARQDNHSKFPTSTITSVTLNESYLTYSGRDGSTKTLVDRLMECNVAFRYNKSFSSETKGALLSSSMTSIAGKNGDLIDFGVLETMLFNANNVGPNMKAADLQPIGAAIFRETFNEFQRTNYIADHVPLYGKVTALIDIIKPSHVLVPVSKEDRYRTGGLLTTTGVSSGIMPDDMELSALVLPARRTYNIGKLNGASSLNNSINDKKQIFLCIGPDDEILCGSNLGHERLPKNLPKGPMAVLGERKLGEKTIYDHKLAACFYVAEVNETTEGVKQTLTNLCMRKGRTAQKNEVRELAVIRLGYVAATKSTAIESEGQYIRLKNFIVDFGDKWSVSRFTYDKVVDITNLKLISLDNNEKSDSIIKLLRPVPTNYSMDFSDEIIVEDENYKPVKRMYAEDLGEVTPGPSHVDDVLYTHEVIGTSKQGRKKVKKTKHDTEKKTTERLFSDA